VAAAATDFRKLRNYPSLFVNPAGFAQVEALFAVLTPVVVYKLKVGGSVEEAS